MFSLESFRTKSSICYICAINKNSTLYCLFYVKQSSHTDFSWRKVLLSTSHLHPPPRPSVWVYLWTDHLQLMFSSMKETFTPRPLHFLSTLSSLGRLSVWGFEPEQKHPSYLWFTWVLLMNLDWFHLVFCALDVLEAEHLFDSAPTPSERSLFVIIGLCSPFTRTGFIELHRNWIPPIFIDVRWTGPISKTHPLWLVGVWMSHDLLTSAPSHGGEMLVCVFFLGKLEVTKCVMNINIHNCESIWGRPWNIMYTRNALQTAFIHY